MTTSYKKYIRPDRKVGLRLTVKERKLILHMVRLGGECGEIVQRTPMGKPILMTLDQWDDFCCYIAAKANHTYDDKLQQKLDVIFSVVEKILNIYSDREPLPTAFNLEHDDIQRDPRLASPAGRRHSLVTAAAAF
jgi:hypothetical protein